MTAHYHSFRELLPKLQMLGFEVVGQDGAGHHRLYHADTDTHTSISATPSDWRGRRNELARLERVAGRKLPRPNAAHYRHQRVTVTEMTMSPIEKQAIEQIDELLAQAAEIRQQWTQVIAGPTNRDTAAAARKVLDRYEDVRDALAALHRTIPPIDGSLT